MNKSEIIEIATAAVSRYAETHPRPPHVNRAQAAKMLRISKPTMGKIVASGKVKLNSCGLIPIDEVDKLIAERL